MDNTHPLYQGTTGHMFGSSSYSITSKGDANLIVGTYMVPEVFPNLDDIYAKGSKIIHIDLNSYEIAKNHRVDIGIVSDPKLSLKALAGYLNSIITPEQRILAKIRMEEIGKTKAERIGAEKEADKKNKGGNPLHMSEFMEILAERLPENTVIFDEALTNSPPVSRYFPAKNPGDIFITRGGSLGIGIPGAIGVKILHPEKTVIGFTGDGGSMYTIQALWSAVRHKTGAKFIVCNNGSYKLLQLNISQYWKERDISKHDFPLSFDLSYPPFQFDQIAKALGVDAVRVEKSEDIVPAIEKMLSDDKPFLIDLVLEREVHPHDVGVKCGQ